MALQSKLKQREERASPELCIHCCPKKSSEKGCGHLWDAIYGIAKHTEKADRKCGKIEHDVPVRQLSSYSSDRTVLVAIHHCGLSSYADVMGMR